MREYIESISSSDILLAAVTSFILTYLILRFQQVMKIIKGSAEVSMEYKSVDLMTVINKCKDLFPIPIISFKGQVFRTGMKVRVTTMQQKVFEGQLIGKNDLDIMCIITNHHIIAHELDKITEMVKLETKEKNIS